MIDDPPSPILHTRVAYHFGDTVYLRASDDPPTAGIITGYLVRPSGLCYQIGWGDRSESSHFECELTSERPSFEP